MKLSLVNHNYKYELEKLIRLFLPFEKIEFSDLEVCENDTAVTVLFDKNGELCAKSTLDFFGETYCSQKKVEHINGDFEKDAELALAECLYECLIAATGYKSPWGIVTGIRSAKLYSRIAKEKGEAFAEEYFEKHLKVSKEKILLCKETNLSEEKIISLSSKNSFSLYISIPFCPSRCSYCSFVSHSVEQAKKLIPQYVELLCEELKQTAKIAKLLKLKLETVYIGGGTPTTLTAEQLKTVMQTVCENFDLSEISEYTVEAGRPDTVTKEKLLVIKEFGATRISINPQTMNDSVLKAIGRNHTAKQTKEAFLLARECGFNNINTDLIAGLPTDTFENFCETVSEVLKLEPESVTVHSLSMKRSSRLTVSGSIPDIEIGNEALKMVNFANKTFKENELFPYYMYRQSKTVGNLENVGYSKKGYECLYNVYIMDETHTILACGASAVTKLREPNGNHIERIFNYKYPYEYITQFSDILSRKEGVVDFYEKYPFGNK